MMKFRRFTAVLLALVMLCLSLSACAEQVTTALSTDGETPSTTDAPASSSKSEDMTGTPPSSTRPEDTTGTPSSSTKVPVTEDTPTTSTPSGGTADPDTDWLSGYLEKMPTLTINTANSEPITSKEVYIGGTITVDSTEDAYNMSEAQIEIRGRGNYTWTSTEKKSYRIKFDKKTNLLGQGDGPAKSWTLLAVHCDQSMLRTAAALTLADHLSGIGFSSSVRFAHVYLNGEYCGVYQVSEQMQVQEYRVDLDDTTKDSDEIDFLVELNTQANEVPVNDGFGHKYEIKSDIWNDEQYGYIADTLNIAFEAITSGDQAYIATLIDLDSVVDTYIVEELFKNLDVGWGSFYMYQAVGGKLHFGPVWDFDLSAGNAEPDDHNPTFPLPQYLYVGSDAYDYSQKHPWFIQLMQYDWFEELVKERWFEVADIINKTPEYVRRVGALYSADFDKNFERWPIFGQKINREPIAVQALRNHDEHTEYVAKWLEQRIAWLNDYFNGKVSANPTGPSNGFSPASGTGTRNDPYLISSANEFYEFTYFMMRGETFRGKYFKQTANIDMAGYIGYNGIGKNGTFEGFYNGNGYIINAEIRGEDECIFPYVTGTVVNVITTGSVTNYAQAAGIARSVRRGGAIINSVSFMNVTSVNQAAAGIVASNQEGGGTVSGCFFGGTLNCESATGAINNFIDGRGGEFSYNYCLESNVGTSVGNETAVSAADAAKLYETMNQNLSKLSGGVAANTLCRWVAGTNNLPTLSHR